jgi:predicted alpha/beta superfamily hydrolase
MLPTLYVPDLRLTFAVGTRHLFNIFSGGALPLCSVAIGYADHDVAARRFRDYTPTKPELPAGLCQPPPFGTGGTASHRDALCRQIIPDLER